MYGNSTNLCNRECLRAGEVNRNDVFGVSDARLAARQAVCRASSRSFPTEADMHLYRFLESISRPVVLSASDEEKSNARVHNIYTSAQCTAALQRLCNREYADNAIECSSSASTTQPCTKNYNINAWPSSLTTGGCCCSCSSGCRP